MKANFTIDPIHLTMDLFEQELTRDVWADKYRFGDEKHPFESFERVVKGVYAQDSNGSVSQEALEAMKLGLWMPAGSIHAAAGTPKSLTYINCFVCQSIPDSVQGISKVLGDGMLTMHKRGGIGIDFSTLRPAGAIIMSTGPTKASGPLGFMPMWDTMCLSLMQAGTRRGAMMGTLSDWHPDLPAFIEAKHTPGFLTNFNLSILVSDAFMDAIRNDELWSLYFPVPPLEGAIGEFVDEDGVTQYIHKQIPARELWDLIIRSTYDYSEPGVIFIDRVNELNNLKYCEEIRCTNPCVTGDTLILTDLGHLPIEGLVGKEVGVWDGREWSEVTPFSTGINHILKVTFSNLAELKVTPYHRFKLRDDSVVEAKDLRVDDELCLFEMPVLLSAREDDPLTDAYSQGFYSGDGTKSSTVSSVYEPSYAVIPRLKGKCWKEQRNKAGVLRKWNHGPMWAKEFVPINSSAEYCVNWLSGLLDADGNLNWPQGKESGCLPVVQLTAKDSTFLDKVRIMLTRLGIQCRIWKRKDAGYKVASGTGKSYYCEATHNLMINAADTLKLVELGLKTERLDLSWVCEVQGRTQRGIKVKSVRAEGEIAETFCFTESKRHMGVFNGVQAQQCGEQPLPPNGACDLGVVNLARMVISPFTSDAKLSWETLRSVVHVGVRFLDNVIDVTPYPLEEQQAEQMAKRRIGLGVSGLADMLAQLRVRYGVGEAEMVARKVMREIAIQAYTASTALAAERGSFPLYEKVPFLEAPFVQKLPSDLTDAISRKGIRNGVLLTVPPTGTISIYYGNISPGVEPPFAHTYKRRVLQEDGSRKEYEAEGYGYRLWNLLHPTESVPDYMVTSEDLSVQDHIRIQAACQEWVDASISKTSNCPADMSFEDFKEVYTLSYNLGCKGCTTFRPSEVRGSILSTGEDKPPSRPEELSGKTYKVSWPSMPSALYVTINDKDGHPYEIFISSKSAKNSEWTTALTLMISALMRTRKDIKFISEELRQVESAYDSAWIDKRFYSSLVARIADVLERHIKAKEKKPEDPKHLATVVVTGAGGTRGTGSGGGVLMKQAFFMSDKEICSACGSPSIIHHEGCAVCTQCGFNSCEG